jgi:hypothetical protein
MTQTQTGSPAPPAAADEGRGSDVPAFERALVAAGDELSDERARQLVRLSERRRARCFVTVIAGEFKRGKSTLLIARAGVEVLPTGVLPVTTVPTRAEGRAPADRGGRVRQHRRSGLGCQS